MQRGGPSKASIVEIAAGGVTLFVAQRTAKIRRRLSAFPHLLCGGINQRVMIAMALACNPKPSRECWIGDTGRSTADGQQADCEPATRKRCKSAIFQRMLDPGFSPSASQIDFAGKFWRGSRLTMRLYPQRATLRHQARMGVTARGCPSSERMGRMSLPGIGGLGSSGVEVMPPGFGGATGGSVWSFP